LYAYFYTLSIREMVSPYSSPSTNKHDAGAEQQQVRRGLQQVVSERQVWMPISAEWFAKWKLYVNFDGTLPEPRDPQVSEFTNPFRAFFIGLP
jgi:hypothetical protein